jgi:hypothetical protein
VPPVDLTDACWQTTNLTKLFPLRETTGPETNVSGRGRPCAWLGAFC